ncbi:MAG: pilus assembly protein [Rhodospirillales bacterium]|nr:pilus assembly protein [Rhodospirillales bacterium]
MRFLFSDRRSVAAVEFALIAPILLVVFFGIVEIATLYRTEAKLNAMTINIAQMVAGETNSSATGIVSVSSGGASPAALQIQNVCQGGILGLAPFPPSGMTVKIASVTLESNSNGLPTTAPVYSTNPTYDMWETDYSVSGSNCNVTSTGSSALIGNTGAVNLATTSPPSATGTSGLNGMLVYPCDNAIIVNTTLTYPGILGVVMQSRPNLSQWAYTRWVYASATSELQCSSSDTGCYVNYAAKQTCNSNNTAN